MGCATARRWLTWLASALTAWICCAMAATSACETGMPGCEPECALPANGVAAERWP